MNLQAGSTGQLSTVTAFANFAGCIARIFTSLQEGGGAAMVRGYILGKIPGPHACGGQQEVGAEGTSKGGEAALRLNACLEGWCLGGEGGRCSWTWGKEGGGVKRGMLA